MIKVDESLTPIKPKLVLCTPSKKGISLLSEAYDINMKWKMGNINELTFKIPYYIDLKHELVENTNVTYTKYRFVVKYIRGDYEEYFMISAPKDNSDDNADYKEIACYSLAYQNKDKTIRSYSKEAIKTEEVMSDALSESTWTVGEIDADLANEYRTYETSSTTSLDFLLQIAEKLNAVLTFDTHNKKVSIYKEDKIGSYKGMMFHDGQYIKSITKETFTEDTCSRLKCFGKDGITINGIMPHGQNYIEDFSYYMNGFELDSNGNVIGHSEHFMSDGLCIAILNYQALIEARTPTFQSLLTQLQTQQEILTTKNNEMYSINNLLDQIEDEIGLDNAYGFDNTADLAEKSSLIAQKNTKQAEIDTINANITNINNQINALRVELLPENNYTHEQLLELDNYVHYKEYTNDSCETEEDLLKAGQEYFNEIKTPKVEFKIDIVNFLESIEHSHNWDKINIGDTVIIYHKTLKINIKVKIIEIEYDHENGNINLTLSNVRNKIDDGLRIAKTLNKLNNTQSQVQQEKKDYRQAYTQSNQALDVLNADTFSTENRKIVSSYNELVQFDKHKQVVIDPNNSNKRVILGYGGIHLTSDGGDNFSTAIDSEKIVADLLQGIILAGQKLEIQATTTDGTSTTFIVDGSGVTLSGGHLVITGGTNGIELSPSNGFIITREDKTARIIQNATDGIKIQKNVGNLDSPLWQDTLYLDLQGIIHANGIQIKEGSFETYDSNGNLVTDLKNDAMGFSTLNVGELISESVVRRNNKTYNAYVDPLNGVDTNSGGIDSPRRTIQSVINGIRKHNDGDINIFIVDNGVPVEFYEEINILGINGYGKITIDFQTHNNLMYGSFIINGCNHNINIKNMNISQVEDGYATLWVHNTRRVVADNCKIFSNSKADYSVSAVNSYCDISNSEVRDSKVGAIASFTSFVNVIDVVGNSAQYGLHASYAGIIGGYGTSSTGDISDTYVSSGGIYQATHLPTPGLSVIPDPPSLIKKVWTSIDADTWEMNVGWLNTTEIMQGTKPNKTNYYIGSYFFGNTLSDTLNGKTIVNIRLYLKRKSYGGNSTNSYVTIRPHYHDTKPVDMPQFTPDSTSVLFDWGEEKWIDIPLSFYDGFSNGTNKGFCVVNTTGSFYNVMENVTKVEALYY